MRTQTIPQESEHRGKMMTALFGRESLIKPSDLDIVDVIQTDYPQTGGEFVLVISDHYPTKSTPWNTRYVTRFGYDRLGFDCSIRPVASTMVLDSTHGLMTYPEAIRSWLRASLNVPHHMLKHSLWPISSSKQNASITLAVLYSVIYGSSEYTQKFIEAVQNKFPGELNKLIEQWSSLNLWHIDYYKRNTI